MLEAKLFCMENGVSAENCDVVIAACSAMDKQDAKEAIAEVLERYPFFKDGQHEKRGMTTGIHIVNGGKKYEFKHRKHSYKPLFRSC